MPANFRERGRILNDKIPGDQNQVGLSGIDRIDELFGEFVIRPRAIVEICEVGDSEASERMRPISEGKILLSDG